MPNQRVHIATWTDPVGHVTAATLQVDQASATVTYAETANEAIRQIKDYLRYLAKRREWYGHTELESVEVRKLRLSIRPLHEHDKLELLLPTQIELRLPCVLGKVDRQNWTGIVPTLGLGFIVHSNAGIQRIAEEQVRQLLAGSSTDELMKHLQVRDIELHEISIPQPLNEIRIHRDTLYPNLESVAAPLGKPTRRQRVESMFQRDQEIAQLTEAMCKHSSSLLLVGDEGIGKSTMLTHAARGVSKYVRESNGPLKAHPVWSTSAGRLIAGMKYLGEWEERCEQVIEELDSIGGWLCVESLHDLILTGGKDPRSSLAAFFLPYIQHGELRMVCEASPEQLHAAERLLPEFVEALTKFSMERLPEDVCGEALQQGAEVIAAQSKVTIPQDVSQQTLRLVRRFEPYRASLAPAMQLLRRLGSSARKEGRDEIHTDDVLAAYAEKTGLPLEILLDQIRLTFDDVVEKLQADVVGQDAACRQVATVVTTFKTGLNAPNRPLGVLLFCGPTGVGKTQLAKTLGNYLFGHSRTDTLVRLDMSEYGGPGAADRLLCKPDRSPSAWIQRVKKQPFCVLLLDEVEKADPQVFDVLMGLMDEGRLTDVYGRVTNFTSTIVIMTSNLGVTVHQDIGFGESETSRFEARVREFFRPEFFNRIDAVTSFAKLSESVCRKIVEMELAKLQSRVGFQRRGVRLDFDSSIIDLLMRTGFDDALGARPLQRSLEQNITAVIARYMTKHHGMRNRTLKITNSKNGLSIL